MQRTRTQNMVLCALFAALTAVFSQIAIPIGPVPINLATFVVFCAGAVLGPRLGPLSLTIWAVLGAVGAPVFSMFRGGLGTLLGPTGGYIIGYIPAAFLVGLITQRLNRENRLLLYPAAMAAGMAAYFALGTVWYMLLTGNGPAESLLVCVLPFLPGDLLKIAAASVLAHRVRPILRGRHAAASPAGTGTAE